MSFKDKISGLQQRAAIIQAVRTFFLGRFFLEVDTPIRLPALIPEGYILPEESADWYLQTSPELCMKRLLAAGVPKLFQICKCFRRGERGARHLPEFTMLEWYRADADYSALMDDCEDLLIFLAASRGMNNALNVGDHAVSLDTPWDRITVEEAFHRYASLSLAAAMEQDVFDEELVRNVEPCLGIDRPVILYDYPVSMAALAMRKKSDPSVAERFELFVAGLELANGFTELTDGDEQRRRFVNERQKIRRQEREPGPMPEHFLEALSRMPPSAGIALGIDRLVMLLTNADSIDDVVPFTPEEL